MSGAPARRDALLAELAARTLAGLVTALAATWRWAPPAGSDPAAVLLGQPGPVVLAAWHEQVLLLAGWLRHRVLPRGMPLAILSSRSRDGEIGARLAGRWGIRVERGSSSRGGAQGLRRLYRALTGGSSVVFLLDGPRGPRYQAKPGAVVLAQTAAVPILPVALAARRFRRLSSWDRLIVPAPFTTVEVRLGEPLRVAPSLSEDGLAEELRRLEAMLGELHR
jgi:lysophospholipid acyltransferase (LPLAT)-like uncharacterized protein